MQEEERKTCVDVLVHNVSHLDVVFLLENEEVGQALARPQFSSFLRTCSQLEGVADGELAYARCARRDSSSPFYSVTLNGEEEIVSGLTLADGVEWQPGFVNDELKVKAKRSSSSSTVTRIYFPILAIVARAWLDDVARPESELKVLLITGTGSPRRESGEVDPRGNSTESAGRLAKRFLERIIPNASVTVLHSETNVFRYDENISFVKNELEPAVEKLRSEIVGLDDWAQRFRVSLSFAEGAPARVSTIHRALRPYRPTSLHVWQQKTFWEHFILSKDDVEVMPFESTETSPALSVGRAEGDALLVINEMKRLVDDFHSKSKHPNDMSSFWHRKSKKVVISVLLVRSGKNDRRLKLYHATNMEVSMPTGSLCAERNVIGTALADDLGLRRSQLKIIAVLGLHLPPLSDPPSFSSDDQLSPARKQIVRHYPKISRHRRTTPASTSQTYRVEQRDLNPLKPCGACAEWLKKIASINPDFSVITFTDASCRGYYVESAILY